MIWLGVAPVWHYMLISAIILLIVLAGRKYLQEATLREDEESLPNSGTASQVEVETPNVFRLLFRKPEILLLQLGLVGLFALIVESAMFDWSAVYFESVVNVGRTLPDQLHISALGKEEGIAIGRQPYLYRLLYFRFTGQYF